MRGQDSTRQVAIANSVADQATAESPELVAREVGDLPAIPAVLGVAESNHSSNLVLDVLINVLNTAVDDGSTLATLPKVTLEDCPDES